MADDDVCVRLHDLSVVRWVPEFPFHDSTSRAPADRVDPPDCLEDQISTAGFLAIHRASTAVSYSYEYVGRNRGPREMNGDISSRLIIRSVDLLCSLGESGLDRGDLRSDEIGILIHYLPDGHCHISAFPKRYDAGGATYWAERLSWGVQFDQYRSKDSEVCSLMVSSECHLIRP